MDTSTHDMSALFAQLGLPGEAAEIERFIETHRPLENRMLLHEADFWNAAQAAFLKEAIENDSDWAERVDELDALLRHGSANS
ncbi:MAG: DUF2789 domain-containing protein [Gammaproteobacteria bacterium]